MHVNITSAGKNLTNSYQSTWGLIIWVFFFLIKAGIIALLEETDDRLIAYSLKQLNTLVDMFWAEIADSITTM